MARIGSKVLSAIIDVDACVGCGICVETCPLGLIQLVDDHAECSDPVACCLGGECAAACPNGAITLP